MSDAAANKSNTGAWITGVVAALVLYVLSIGLLEGLAENDRLPESAVSILKMVYAPINMLPDPVIEGPLVTYFEWWRELLEKP